MAHGELRDTIFRNMRLTKKVNAKVNELTKKVGNSADILKCFHSSI